MIGSKQLPFGLTNHPRVKEAAIKAIEKIWYRLCRFTASKMEIFDIHEELEKKLARFLRKEAALVFATGYQTNLGVISALVGRNDVAIIDMYDHASILDGCRLSFGRSRNTGIGTWTLSKELFEGAREKTN